MWTHPRGHGLEGRHALKDVGPFGGRPLLLVTRRRGLGDAEGHAHADGRGGCGWWWGGHWLAIYSGAAGVLVEPELDTSSAACLCVVRVCLERKFESGFRCRKKGFGCRKYPIPGGRCRECLIFPVGLN